MDQKNFRKELISLSEEAALKDINEFIGTVKADLLNTAKKGGNTQGVVATVSDYSNPVFQAFLHKLVEEKFYVLSFENKVRKGFNVIISWADSLERHYAAGTPADYEKYRKPKAESEAVFGGVLYCGIDGANKCCNCGNCLNGGEQTDIARRI